MIYTIISYRYENSKNKRKNRNYRLVVSDEQTKIQKVPINMFQTNLRNFEPYSRLMMFVAPEFKFLPRGLTH